MYEIEEALNIMKVSVGGICRRVDEEHGCSEAELGKWISIESAFYTPFFVSSCSGTKDIALLKLAESVSDDIHHICLPHLHDTDELYDSTARLFSSGYGSDRVKMTDAECDENLDSRKPDTFCTFERAERNVCHGDSGGGVTTSLEGRHYLVGLVSFGTSCTDLAMGSRAGAQV
ncbi:unnamed protein product [Angiostrongylus costaricensis]|uniref:Peptidase S1 domain-containing protein n=1 Tax=Angiostrongylus costaricensis TaxID=334426 RepID=A0A0R3PSL1_ANGCS|nr:unnamed protein product [Angiostrongylus costaricensis]